MILYIDGSTQPNPGPSGIGVVIEDEQGQQLSTISRYIGRATNNQAEYRALLAGLEKAASFSPRPPSVEVRSDSELIVKQLQGIYRVKKAELMPLHSRALELSRAFPSFSIVWIPRDQNKAHSLADRALKPGV